MGPVDDVIAIHGEDGLVGVIDQDKAVSKNGKYSGEAPLCQRLFASGIGSINPMDFRLDGGYILRVGIKIMGIGRRLTTTAINVDGW